MKRAANLTVDAELLEQARDLGVNLSQVLDEALRERIARAKGKRWLAENTKAVSEHNERVEKKGVFSDRHRRF